ncbi:hypothetical protein AB0F30_01655 [Streptomyces sp. NPDC029006]|uniref:antibiotic biosynthesis monooxygenase family protein n=1 Tax=Streptomyces sp. NPDC029006 TaxID=3155467 RepID=UPI003410E46C
MAGTSDQNATTTEAVAVAEAAPAAVADPVPPYEPPYHAVVFTSVRTDDDPDGYDRAGARLSGLVKDIPGFLGEDLARTPGGLTLSVVRFRDLVRPVRDPHRAGRAQPRLPAFLTRSQALPERFLCASQRKHRLRKASSQRTPTRCPA